MKFNLPEAPPEPEIIIHTEIENDEAYRKRLLKSDWERLRLSSDREAAIQRLSSVELDGLGIVHHMPRIHTHRTEAKK